MAVVTHGSNINNKDNHNITNNSLALMAKCLTTLFNSKDVKLQPRFIVGSASQDCDLLIQIHEYIRLHTSRGGALNKHPLTVIGVAATQDVCTAAQDGLARHCIPNKVLIGHENNLVEIDSMLEREGVDPSQVLYVHSYNAGRLWEDAPQEQRDGGFMEGDPTALYAGTALLDAPCSGRLDAFTSLVERFQCVSSAVKNSLGVCMLEELALNIPAGGAKGRSCSITAAGFTMAAAMAGLLPKKLKDVQTAHQTGGYLLLSQHLAPKPFCVRFACTTDLPGLVAIEELSWGSLGAPEEVLRRRLEVSPTTNLVCVMQGRVVAVLYMQLIEKLDAIWTERFLTVSDAHTPNGRILQLIAIATHPDVKNMGIGAELKNFALTLACLDEKIDTVVAVTRCGKFSGCQGSLQDYIDAHQAGKVLDPILDFHTGSGAHIVGLVPHYRPADTANFASGVLIQYHLSELTQAQDSEKGAPKEPDQKAAPVQDTPTLELLSRIMQDLGHELDMDDLDRGFFAYGMDSLELVMVRNSLGAAIDLDLPATLLLDFPTARELSQELDRERGVSLQNEDAKLEEASTAASTTASSTASTTNSAPDQTDLLDAQVILAFQRMCMSAYAQPSHQGNFTKLAQRCFPDMLMYLLAVEELLAEAEGPILLEAGIIGTLHPAAVRRGRALVTASLNHHWSTQPELRRRSRQILRLTKQDQQWQ